MQIKKNKEQMQAFLLGYVLLLGGFFSHSFVFAKEADFAKGSYVSVELATSAFSSSSANTKSRSVRSKGLSAGQKVYLPAEFKVESVGYLKLQMMNGSLELAPLTRVTLINRDEKIILSLIEGEILLRSNSGAKAIGIEVPLLEAISSGEQRVLQVDYNIEAAKVTMSLLSGVPLELKSYGQGAPPEILKEGSSAAFQARKDDQGQISIDQILSGKRAVVGEWILSQSDQGGFLAESEKSWSQFRKNAAAQKAREQRAQARKVVWTYLCKKPNGNFNDCVYRRSSASAKSERVCLRQRCLANGQWGSDFTYPVGQGPCESREFVASCDY